MEGRDSATCRHCTALKRRRSAWCFNVQHTISQARRQTWRSGWRPSYNGHTTPVELRGKDWGGDPPTRPGMREREREREVLTECGRSAGCWRVGASVLGRHGVCACSTTDWPICQTVLARPFSLSARKRFSTRVHQLLSSPPAFRSISPSLPVPFPPLLSPTHPAPKIPLGGLGRATPQQGPWWCWVNASHGNKFSPLWDCVQCKWLCFVDLTSEKNRHCFTLPQRIPGSIVLPPVSGVDAPETVLHGLPIVERQLHVSRHF